MSVDIGGSMLYANVTITGHVGLVHLLVLALTGIVLALGVWLIILAGRWRERNHVTRSTRKPMGRWTGSIAAMGGVLIVGGVLLGSSTVAAMLSDLIRVTG